MKAISRNRGWFLGSIVLAVLVLLFTWSAGYRINLTPSLPKGVYRVFPESYDSSALGDLVSFCLDGEFATLAGERGYLQPGSCPSGLRPLLKRVAGLPGDVVDVGRLALRPLDSMGRPVPSVLQNGIIPSGMVLLMAQHPGSFDGRYFGLVPLECLRRVEEVWAW